jgi:two-component system LytT family response regulator
MAKTLQECELLLDRTIFYRCHNSHLVNLKKFVEFVGKDGLVAQMTDGYTVPVAKKNKEEFLERLKKIAG